MNVILANLSKPNPLPTSPLGIETLAGHLAAVLPEVNVSMIDFATFREHRRALQAMEELPGPALIGLSAMWADLPFIAREARDVRARWRDAFIVLGGAAVVHLGEAVLARVPEIDFAVSGEGERALERLVGGARIDAVPNLHHRRADGSIGFTFREQWFPARGGPPDRRLLWKQEGDVPYAAANLEMSRGCAFGACTFCHLTAEARHHRLNSSGRYVKYRVIDSDVAWQDYVKVCSTRPQRINFVDEEFFGGRGDPLGSSGASLLRRMAETGVGVDIPKLVYLRAPDVTAQSVELLVAAGVSAVFLGIESGHQGDLAIFAKGTSVDLNRRAINLLFNARIRLKAGFIMLHPLSTGRSILGNIEFLADLGILDQIRNPLNTLDLVPDSTLHVRLRTSHPQLLTRTDQYGYVLWLPHDPVLRKHWVSVVELNERLEGWTDRFRIRHADTADGSLSPEARRVLSAVNRLSLDWLATLGLEAIDGCVRDEQRKELEGRLAELMHHGGL